MTRSVYVIKSEPGPVKIGIATKPKARFSEIQVASSVPLSLEYVGQCSEIVAAKQIEAKAHEILRSHHCRGEWFSVSTDEAIKAVMQAAEELGYKLRRQFVVTRSRNCMGPLRPFQRKVNDTFIATIDDWRRRRPDFPSRAEAIRRLIYSHAEIKALGHRPIEDDLRKQEAAKPKPKVKK
jgi:hypothetical protein